MIRMDQARIAKKILENKSKGKRKIGSSRLRWVEDVENNL
jgi:hypothetical protein